MTDVTIKVSLDDESKKLLKAGIAAAAKLASTAAAPAAGKTTKTKPGKTKPAADDSFEGDDGDGDDAGDEDGDDAGDEDGDGDDAGDEDGDGDGEDGEDGEGEDSGPSIDDVGEAMKSYAMAKGPGGSGSKALAMKLLKAKGGVDALSKLKPAKFAAVIEACNVAAKKLKKKPA